MIRLSRNEDVFTSSPLYPPRSTASPSRGRCAAGAPGPASDPPPSWRTKTRSHFRPSSCRPSWGCGLSTTTSSWTCSSICTHRTDSCHFILLLLFCFVCYFAKQTMFCTVFTHPAVCKLCAVQFICEIKVFERDSQLCLMGFNLPLAALGPKSTCILGCLSTGEVNLEVGANK